jgi:RNA polymerase sigma-70 factor, ECF subfamily
MGLWRVLLFVGVFMSFENLLVPPELIKSAQGGDRVALEKILKKYEAFAFHTAFSFLHNKETAQDVAQEALIKIARNISKFKNKSKLSTWAYRIIRNCINDSYRKNKNHLFEELTEENAGVSSDSPHMQIEDNEIWGQISASLDILSSEKREIVILFDIQGFSFREISELLDMPQGTVKSKWSRAKNKLRKHFVKKKIVKVELN